MSGYTHFWVSEFRAYLEDKAFNVKTSSEFKEEDYFPLMPLLSLIDKLRVEGVSYLQKQILRLKDNLGNVLVEVSPKYGDFSNTRDEVVFFHKKSVDEGLISSLDMLLQLDKMKILSNREEVYALDGSAIFSRDNIGVVKPKYQGTKRLCFLTPVYRRLEVLKLFMDYTLKYIVPYLELHNYDCVFVLLGSVEEKSVMKEFTNEDNLVFYNIENNLGLKKNKSIDIARKLQSDLFMFLDSDDLLSPKTVIELIEKAELNTYWSAIEQFSFFSCRSKDYSFFKGYGQRHPLHKQGMGSGRVFTKKLIDSLGSDLFALQNKRMDESVKAQLVKLNLSKEDFLIEETEQLPIGIKTEINIWSEKDYSTQRLEESDTRISWLPSKIKGKLNLIEY